MFRVSRIMVAFNKCFPGRGFVSISLLLAFFCFGTQAYAEPAEPNKSADLFDMSLEELMEVPVVFSSSRQEQKITDTSVPVTIVTAEDIHYSGLTNIPEILKFEPGVNVVKFNRTIYGVGVRGLHESVSNRTLVLVDGRSANDPFSGGGEFHKLPVFLEDIDHIEVVRGPAGASWGANAFNGVINIITKKPEDTLGYFASTTVTEFGDTFTHLRWGAKKGDWSWRLSTGYEDTISSEDAGAGDYVSTSTGMNGFIHYDDYVAHDFARNWRFDGMAVYQPDPDTKISMGAGYSHLIYGDYEVAGYYLGDRNNRSETSRLFTKIEHEFENGSSGYVQWAGNISNTNWVNLGKYNIIENDVEAQYNFAPVNGHHITIGGNLRWDHIGLGSDDLDYYSYRGQPYDDKWAGLFVIDRWDVTEKLALEAQVRADWYSQVSTDWSNRFTALYDLFGNDKHMLRFSVAKAFRAPLDFLTKMDSHTIPIGINHPVTGEPLYAIYVERPEDLKNEQTWSVEAGYTGTLSNTLTLKVNTFYQRMRNLIGYDTRDFFLYPAIPAGQYAACFTPANIDGADMYGGEIELAHEDKQKKISAWYALNKFQTDLQRQYIRAYEPVESSFGLTGRLFLPDGWTFNTNFKVQSTTDRIPFVDSKHAALDGVSLLDLTISKKIVKGQGEIMFGVSDVLNETSQPVAETISMTGHSTPGRTFFVRMQMKF